MKKILGCSVLFYIYLQTISTLVLTTVSAYAQYGSHWYYSDSYEHGGREAERQHSRGYYSGSGSYGGMIGNGLNRNGYRDSARSWQSIDNYEHGGPRPGRDWNR